MNARQPKFTITNRMSRAVTPIERARGFLEAARRSSDWVREVGERALLNYRGDPITEGMIREIHRKPVEDVRGVECLSGEMETANRYAGSIEFRTRGAEPPGG